MKIKTRKNALSQTFYLWIWCAVNPDKSKTKCPIWKMNGGYLEHCKGCCPCCEYLEQLCLQSCEIDCPINWSGSWCFSGEYGKYQKAKTFKDRTKWALKIAELALDAL